MASLDVAKLVLGYLTDKGFEKTKSVFCQECNDLEKLESSQTNIISDDKKLSLIVEEYAVLKGYDKLSQRDPESVLIFLWKQFDVLVGQLKHSSVHALRQQKGNVNIARQAVRVREQNRQNRVTRQRRQKQFVSNPTLSSNQNITNRSNQNLRPSPAKPLNGGVVPNQRIPKNQGFTVPGQMAPSVLVHNQSNLRMVPVNQSSPSKEFFQNVPSSPRLQQISPLKELVVANNGLPYHMRLVPINHNPQLLPSNHAATPSVMFLPVNGNSPSTEFILPNQNLHTSSNIRFQPISPLDEMVPQNHGLPSSAVVQPNHSSPSKRLLPPQHSVVPQASASSLPQNTMARPGNMYDGDPNYLKIHIPRDNTSDIFPAPSKQAANTTNNLQNFRIPTSTISTSLSHLPSGHTQTISTSGAILESSETLTELLQESSGTDFHSGNESLTEHSLPGDHFRSPKRKSAPPKRRYLTTADGISKQPATIIQSPLKQPLTLPTTQDGVQIESLVEKILGQPLFSEKLAENINRAVELDVSPEVKEQDNESSAVVDSAKVDNILEMMKNDPTFEKLFSNFESFSGNCDEHDFDMGEIDHDNISGDTEISLQNTDVATDALLLLANSPAKFSNEPVTTSSLQTPEKNILSPNTHSLTVSTPKYLTIVSYSPVRNITQALIQPALSHIRQLDFETITNPISTSNRSIEDTAVISTENSLEITHLLPVENTTLEDGAKPWDSDTGLAQTDISRPENATTQERGETSESVRSPSVSSHSSFSSSLVSEQRYDKGEKEEHNAGGLNSSGSALQSAARSLSGVDVSHCETMSQRWGDSWGEGSSTGGKVSGMVVEPCVNSMVNSKRNVVGYKCVSQCEDKEEGYGGELESGGDEMETEDEQGKGRERVGRVSDGELGEVGGREESRVGEEMMCRDTSVEEVEGKRVWVEAKDKVFEKENDEKDKEREEVECVEGDKGVRVEKGEHSEGTEVVGRAEMEEDKENECPEDIACDSPSKNKNESKTEECSLNVLEELATVAFAHEDVVKTGSNVAEYVGEMRDNDDTVGTTRITEQCSEQIKKSSGAHEDIEHSPKKSEYPEETGNKEEEKFETGTEVLTDKDGQNGGTKETGNNESQELFHERDATTPPSSDASVAARQVAKRKLKRNKRQNGTSKKRRALPMDLDVDKFLSQLHYAEGGAEKS